MLKIIIIILLFTTASYAQLTEQQAAAKRQLEEMSAALGRGDLDSFISFINPALVAYMGGADSLRRQMQPSLKEVNSSIKSISMSEPTKIFRMKSQLQCIITDTINMVFYGNPTQTLDNVIAVSDDGGMKWTFINCGKSPDTFAQFKPHLPKIAPELEKMLVKRLLGK
jgi:hypothetical protein